MGLFSSAETWQSPKVELVSGNLKEMKSLSKRVSLVEQIDFLAHFAGVMKKTESLVNKQII